MSIDRKQFEEFFDTELLPIIVKDTQETLFEKAERAVQDERFHDAILLLRCLLFIDAENREVRNHLYSVFGEVFKKKYSGKIIPSQFLLRVRDILIYLIYFNAENMFFCKMAGSGDVIPSSIATETDLVSGREEDLYKCIGIAFPDESVVFVVPTKEAMLYIPSFYVDAKSKSVTRYEKYIRLEYENGEEIVGQSRKGTTLFDISDFVSIGEVPVEESGSVEIGGVKLFACNL